MTGIECIFPDRGDVVSDRHGQNSVIAVKGKRADLRNRITADFIGNHKICLTAGIAGDHRMIPVDAVFVIRSCLRMSLVSKGGEQSDHKGGH